MSYISGGGGGGGGTPGGVNTNVQFNNAGAFGGDANFTYTTPGQVTIALGTIAANAKALNITGTFNAGGVTFDAPLSMAITDTASAAGSLLLDLQVGGSTKFSVSKAGAIVGLNFTSAAQGLTPSSGGGTTNFLRADATWAAPPGVPGGANTQVQFNNTGAFGADSGFTYAGTGQATLALGTIAANAKALNVTATWNNAAVTFDAPLFMVITPTAFANQSKHFTVNDGTNDIIYFCYENGLGAGNKDPALKALTGDTGHTGAIEFTSYGTTLSYDGANAFLAIGLSGFETQGAWARNTIGIGWVSGTTPQTAPDTGFFRQAAGVVSLDNPHLKTSACGFQVYNTTDANTSPTNYERAAFDWTTSANVLTIGAQAGGTGTVRQVNLVGGVMFPIVSEFTVDIAGQFIFSVLSNPAVQIASNTPLGWSSTTSSRGTADSGLQRVAAKVLSFSDGASNANGWLQWAGQARVTSDVTYTSTTVLATVTGLSVALQAGRTYSFDVYLSFTDAAAGGIQAAMVATGGLTATAIEYDGWIIDSGSNGIKGNAQSAALAGVVASSTTTGTAGVVQIKGTITVNVAGTLNVQAAQNTSSGTATTVKRGSYMIVQDMP